MNSPDPGLARLSMLLDAHAVSGNRRQRPIPWPRGRWLSWLPQHSDVIERLPSSLDRTAVRSTAESPTTGDQALAGFLAAMIWGFGNSGYGPWRVCQALAGRPDLPIVLLEAAKAAAVDAVAAYAVVAAHRPPRIGPAFATKYLYFCVPESSGSPLILDRLVAGWLREHAGFHINPVPWSAPTYRRYLGLIRTWASELHTSPALVEELIFRDTAGGQWSDPLTL
jgi:hypothetical protein